MRMRRVFEGDVVKFLPSKTKNTAAEDHHLNGIREHAKLQHEHDNTWSQLSKQAEKETDPDLKHHYSKLVAVHQEAAQIHNSIKHHHFQKFAASQRTRAENRQKSRGEAK